jgi:ABC-2 type transport system permease protein
MEVIYVHWLRKIRRYLRSRSQVLSSVAQPILYLLALGYGLGPTFRSAGQGSYLQFITPGIVAMSILFSAAFSGIDLVYDRRFGFLRGTCVAPVPALYIMIGRVLGGATVALVQGTLVLIISIVVGFRPASVLMFLYGFLFMVAISIMATAFGMAVGSRMTDLGGFQILTNFVLMPVFFFSGALYPLTNISLILLLVSRSNPLTYGVEGMRTVLTGNLIALSAGADLSIVLGVATLFLLLGSVWFSRIRF